MLPTAPPDVVLDRSALFLDFDGTLVDIAERPDHIALAQGTIGLLSALRERLGGALAIVSGRDIADLDRYLSPLQLCMAGVHGLVRRDAEGCRHDAPLDASVLAQFKAALTARLSDCDGLLVEEKTGAVALHYRRRPELAPACQAAVATAVAELGGADLRVMHGKMVIETRLDGHTKGTAIAAFMKEAPFRDRQPVFAGDDVTDEDGFAVVDRAGGVAIKVGEGDTRAAYRMASPALLRAWLMRLVETDRAALGENR